MRRSWKVLLSLAMAAGIYGLAPAEDKPAEKKEGAAAPTPAETKANDPKLTYAAGVAIGRRVRDLRDETGTTGDNELLLQGVRDGIEGKESKYTGAELETAVAAVERAMAERRAAAMVKADPEFAAEAKSNEATSKAKLAEWEMLEGVDKLSSGVLVQVLKEGDGPYVAETRKISVNYKIMLITGVPVDSSPEGKPAIIDTATLSPAVRNALAEQQVGSTLRLAIPAEHAFGLAGRPPLIGPNQAILVEVALVALEK